MKGFHKHIKFLSHQIHRKKRLCYSSTRVLARLSTCILLPRASFAAAGSVWGCIYHSQLTFHSSNAFWIVSGSATEGAPNQGFLP